MAYHQPQVWWIPSAAWSPAENAGNLFLHHLGIDVSIVFRSKVYGKSQNVDILKSMYMIYLISTYILDYIYIYIIYLLTGFFQPAEFTQFTEWKDAMYPSERIFYDEKMFSTGEEFATLPSSLVVTDQNVGQKWSSYLQQGILALGILTPTIGLMTIPKHREQMGADRRQHIYCKWWKYHAGVRCSNGSKIQKWPTPATQRWRR